MTSLRNSSKWEQSEAFWVCSSQQNEVRNVCLKRGMCCCICLQKALEEWHHCLPLFIYAFPAICVARDYGIFHLSWKCVFSSLHLLFISSLCLQNHLCCLVFRKKPSTLMLQSKRKKNTLFLAQCDTHTQHTVSFSVGFSFKVETT